MLYVYNTSATPRTLVGVTPPVLVPASLNPPFPGPKVNVTSELYGLDGSQYAALEVQRQAEDLVYFWDSVPDYQIPTLGVREGSAQQGTVIADFGPWPGAPSPLEVVVPNQIGLASDSFLQAWVDCRLGTVDHTPDEHVIENLKVSAGKILADSFTIFVESTVGRTYGKWRICWRWT